MSLVTESWLENSTSIKCLLVELGVIDVISNTSSTMYLSTSGYNLGNSQISYMPVLSGSFSTTESLSLDGSLSLSFGDIEIQNPNGELDTWLDNSKYIWANQTVKVYFGDPRWSSQTLTDVASNFELVFNGIIQEIDSKSRDTLNIKIADKLQRLNAPLSEEKIGTYGTWSGGQPNKDTIKPLVFGEAFNMTPELIDPATLEYQVNNGSTELIIEVRDNGSPIYTDAAVFSGAVTLGTRPNNVTVDLTTGKFKLKSALAGACTASVQGVKKSINLADGTVSSTYTNNIANLIALITTQYGNSNLKLTATDLDLGNLSAFAAANTQPVGYLVTDRTNVLEVCQSLAASIGAQIYMTRKGLLQLLKLAVQGTATTEITDSDILYGSLSISNKTDVLAGAKVAYSKNWTVQADLLTSIPEAHKRIFATDYYTESSVDETVKTTYKLYSDPQPKNICLLKQSDAAAEAQRLRDYFKVPRIVYKFTGTSKLLTLVLGQAVKLTHYRFNLSGGKIGQVVGLSPNWITGQVEVEVII